MKTIWVTSSFYQRMVACGCCEMFLKHNESTDMMEINIKDYQSFLTSEDYK